MALRLVDNYSAFSLARDQLLVGETVTMRVRGQSMLPFFRSGSQIVLRPVRDEDFRVGRVVMADAGNERFVVHRIYRVEGEQITLLGDGNTIGTETMSREKVYGVVDCSRVHLWLALVWQWMRPLRRYPLAIMRRIFPK